MSENEIIAVNVERENFKETEKKESTIDDECQRKEKQLEEKFIEYKNALDQEKSKVSFLQTDLKICTKERDDMKKQVVHLEKELAQRSLKGNKNQDPNSKDMVTKARSVIFEKTKVCKNQELQIEALIQQVASLKEIVSISKDMLDIRNTEVNQLRDKLDCMDLKFSVEKDRHALMNAKLEKMIQINADLKIEYETQLKLFSELQKQYRKQQGLSNEINGTKENTGDSNEQNLENA